MMPRSIMASRSPVYGSSVRMSPSTAEGRSDPCGMLTIEIAGTVELLGGIGRVDSGFEQPEIHTRPTSHDTLRQPIARFSHDCARMLGDEPSGIPRRHG